MSAAWLPVIGYEGLYEVSDEGAVRSLDRAVVGKNGVSKRIRGVPLKPVPRGDGYLQVTLWKDGKSRTPLIQHLVAAAFFGPRPVGQYVCHDDGVKVRNGLGNLRYDTPTGNSLDAVAHRTASVLKLDSVGEANGNARLTAKEVIEIRAKVAAGMSRAAAAKAYGVSHSTVKLIIRRKIWQHV